MHYGHDDGGDDDVGDGDDGGVVGDDDDDYAGDDGNRISFNLFFHYSIIRCQRVLWSWWHGNQLLHNKMSDKHGGYCKDGVEDDNQN